MVTHKGANRAEEGTINAYQKIVSNWVFEKPISFQEDFAQRRFLKKMEQPSVKNEKVLRSNAWDQFIHTDTTLPPIHLPSREWYRARALLHSWIRGDRRRSPIDFPKGSSVVPTNGFNSIEFRLAGGPWTCTPENFDEFSRLVYNHKALKRAFRRRYTRWFLNNKFSITYKESERILWKRLQVYKNPAWEAFRWKMSRITTIVYGSRFSTVPKNNQVCRPINIEPFGNLLVQRQLGNFLRSCLKNQGIDLDNLAERHRLRVSDSKVATIDLKSASDSVSMQLVEFMLPKGIFDSISTCRSSLLFGLDKEYHILKKVSSMGNGFTFELMTIILNALCRTLDPTASVFGDDIIIEKDYAPRLISLLQEVGFQVNLEKSFIEGPFRESCGANYHDECGYIKSFDFLYPKNIGECALILTKCYALKEYPSFRLLYDQLFKRTPKALLGGPLKVSELRPWDQPDLIVGFACDKDYLKKDEITPRGKDLIEALQHNEVLHAVEFHWKPELRTKTTRSLSSRSGWAKYEMYLHACRVCDDIISGRGQWAMNKVHVIDNHVYR